MNSNEDIEKYIGAYSNNIFERENMLTINNYYSKCISYSIRKDTLLELGIGYGLNLKNLKGIFSKATVIEGSKKLILKHQNLGQYFEFVHDYFESFQTSQKYSIISMGFVLEHVDDPVKLLAKYKSFLNNEGVMYVGVPNAMSLHRIIGNNAGFLDDIKQMSEADYACGHRRFLTNDEWLALFVSAGFKVSRNEGLYLKPITTQQLASLELGDSVYNALCIAAQELPSISNSCFYELKPEA